MNERLCHVSIFYTGSPDWKSNAPLVNFPIKKVIKQRVAFANVKCIIFKFSKNLLIRNNWYKTDCFLSVFLWLWYQVEFFFVRLGLLYVKHIIIMEQPGQYPKTCSPKAAYPTII